MRNVLNMLLAVVFGCSAGVVGPSRAEEGKAPQAPKKVPQVSEASIQFFSTGPQLPCVTYKMNIVVEIEDSNTKFEHAANFSAGASADLLAHFFGRVLKDEVGWKYEVKGGKLVIEGWRDPKTGRVHRVKKIEIETDIPKDCKPKIEVPKKG